MAILDSGDRREFDSGAVRDMSEDKGRCDLLPLEVVGQMLGDAIFGYIRDFQKTNDTDYLYEALDLFIERNYLETQTMFLEVAKHFAEGCKKYGENNWRKGIPTYCYIDSATRHYLKFLRGDKDEDHSKAFCWNLICCIWEVDYHDKN